MGKLFRDCLYLAKSEFGVELAGLVLALDVLAALLVVVFECLGDVFCVIGLQVVEAIGQDHCVLKGVHGA